jgi:hypothetical protein
MAARHVRGSFFAEYVRMLRRRKDVPWEQVLPEGDLPYLEQRIEADAWYPMATFERFGLAILAKLEGATLDGVRMWGRLSAQQFARDNAGFIAVRDPIETMMRLMVQRQTLFDFPAFDMPMLVEGEAYVLIDYRMSEMAEEAACFQTLGFCEGIVGLAGAVEARGHFAERSWCGDARTRLVLEWRGPGPHTP